MWLDGHLDVAAHVLGRVELRFLLQEADLDARLWPCLALELLVHAGHDPQQGGLAGAVQAQHADLGSGEETQRDVAEDDALRRHDLADAVHGVDELSHVSGSLRGGKRAAIMRLRRFSCHVPWASGCASALPRAGSPSAGRWCCRVAGAGTPGTIPGARTRRPCRVTPRAGHPAAPPTCKRGASRIAPSDPTPQPVPRSCGLLPSQMLATRSAATVA
jgi:hypothetical protein